MTWIPVLTLLGRLIVETGSPDALCPDLASAEDAIHARLGALEAGDAANWRLRYTIGHAPDAASGDFVRLELYDPQNELRLSRDLPLAGESCATVAGAMALVVDRFFRALVAEQKTEPAAPAEEPAARVEPAATPPAGPAVPPPRPRSTSALTARVGVLSPPFSPTLGAGYTLRTPQRFSLAAELSWVVAPTTEELDAGGRAESRSALIRFSPAWDLPLDGAQVALGPTLAVAGERATTDLPEAMTESRVVAAVGAQACLRLGVGRHLGLELTVGAEAPFRPFGGSFMVADEEVLEPPELRGFLAIGVGPLW